MAAFSSSDVDRVSGDPLAHGLDDLRQACDGAVARLKASTGWSDGDRRIVAVHRLRNIAQSLLAAFAFHRAIFPTEAFWQAFFQAIPTSSDFTNHNREFDTLVRFVGLQGMFSAMESDLRSIVSALDATACGGATAEFDSIVRWLFARATSAATFQDFVDLLRLTRNTIHHNGVFRPRRGGDVSIVIDGREYKFVVGQPIDFADWSFVIFVGGRLVELMETIAKDPVVAALQVIA